MKRNAIILVHNPSIKKIKLFLKMPLEETMEKTRSTHILMCSHIDRLDLKTPRELILQGGAHPLGWGASFMVGVDVC